MPGWNLSRPLWIYQVRNEETNMRRILLAVAGYAVAAWLKSRSEAKERAEAAPTPRNKPAQRRKPAATPQRAAR